MRFVIHIGLHKTGTTSLQNVLSENVNYLGEHGVGYFQENSRIPSGNGLGHLVLREGTLADFPIGDDRKNKLAKSFKKFIDEDTTTKIISGESLSLMRTSDELERLISLIGTRNIEVILTLREKKAWWKSYEQQILKTGIKSIHPDSAANLKNKQWLLDHEALVAILKNTLGDEKVHILNYDKVINYEIMKIIDPELDVSFEKKYNVRRASKFYITLFLNTNLGQLGLSFYRQKLTQTYIGRSYRRLKKLLGYTNG